MEERRLEGGRLLRAGKLSQAEIAVRLGVSRATVSDWAQQLAEEGPTQLRRRKSNGRPPKLKPEQQQRLLAQLSSRYGETLARLGEEGWERVGMAGVRTRDDPLLKIFFKRVIGQ